MTQSALAAQPAAAGGGAAGSPGAAAEGSPSYAGGLQILLIVGGLFMLDFSTLVTAVNQEALGAFVLSVGKEAFQGYVDDVLEAGAVSDQPHPGVPRALELLGLASNLTGSPREAGEASLRLGEIRSRFLSDWIGAAPLFEKAEVLSEHRLAAPKYHMARYHLELQQPVEAAAALKEAIRRGQPAESDPAPDPEGAAIHSCLAPLELAKLILPQETAGGDSAAPEGPEVAAQPADYRMLSDALQRGGAACPPAHAAEALRLRERADRLAPKGLRKPLGRPKGRGRGSGGEDSRGGKGNRGAPSPGSQPPAANGGSGGAKHGEKSGWKGAGAKHADQHVQAKKQIDAFLSFVREAHMERALQSLGDLLSNTVIVSGMPQSPLAPGGAAALDSRAGAAAPPAAHATPSIQPRQPGAVVNPFLFPSLLRGVTPGSCGAAGGAPACRAPASSALQVPTQQQTNGSGKGEAVHLRRVAAVIADDGVVVGDEEGGHRLELPAPAAHDAGGLATRGARGFERLSVYQDFFNRVSALRDVVRSKDPTCDDFRSALNRYANFIQMHKRDIIPLLEREHRALLQEWKKHNDSLRRLCSDEEG